MGGGANVIVVNGAGSDFADLAAVPNITFFPPAEERDLIAPLADFLDATVRESLRRDHVWPPGTPTPGATCRRKPRPPEPPPAAPPETGAAARDQAFRDRMAEIVAGFFVNTWAALLLLWLLFPPGDGERWR